MLNYKRSYSMRCVLFLLLIIVPNMLYAQKDSKIDDEIKEQVKLKVGMLCEYISTIADNIKPTETARINRMHLKNKALSFFIGKGDSYEENGVTKKGVVMAVTSTNRTSVQRRLMKNYLTGLVNLDKRSGKVNIRSIEFIGIKMSNLQPHPTAENMYICTCDVEVYQPYNGLDQLGICGERNIKRIKCYINFSESIDIISGDVVYEPRVLFGDIEAMESVRLNNN